MTRRDHEALRLRALAEMRRTLRALAGETRVVNGGFVVATAELPLVWSLNQIHLTDPVGFAAAAALAEEHQGRQGYRHIVVEDDAAGRMGEAARAAGWKADREVLMALVRQPDRPTPRRGIEELSEEEMLGLMARWLKEGQPGVSPAGLEQVGEYNRREGRLWHETRLGMRDDGKPAALTKVRAEGGVGWVEDVYTVPGARRRGYARMLVTEATERLRAAGSECVFIVADDNDWPKELYGKIGFEPVGYMATLHRLDTGSV